MKSKTGKINQLRKKYGLEFENAEEIKEVIKLRSTLRVDDSVNALKNEVEREYRKAHKEEKEKERAIRAAKKITIG